MRRRPPSPTLFPYTTLFRSWFRLRLVWNADGDEFRAALDDAADVSLPYPPEANSRPANSPFALIRTQHLRSEEHTSELQSRVDLVCRLLLEKKKEKRDRHS